VQPTTNSIAQVVFPTDPPPHDGRLLVRLEPPEALAAGAGWRILGSGNTNYVADNLAALPLLPATYTVEFRPAAGFAPSPHRSVQVPPAGQTTVITNHYQLTRPTIGSLVATGGTFRLRIQSIPGQRYVLEASSNLAGWYPVATNSSVTSGTWDFADPAAGTRSRLFYRGRSDP
jgi:hypothetical protein